MSPKKDVRESGKRSKEFTDEERAAMKERARELKAEARANKNQAEGERDVLAKIAAMPEPDRAISQRLHAIIRASAPELAARLWYGQPAYAKDGKVVCFFRTAEVDKERYLTLGFTSTAKLDEGHLWPTAFALTALTAAEEARIGALVKKAAG
ncbi:MAG: DUF1801 domain-containing protein [Dethiobacter sp.]|nr:DUF1801 domain-containing protein [Dethiobacter sp.]